MREATGNFWDYQKPGSVLAITTNGIVNPVPGSTNYVNIMGAGIAKQAKIRFPDLPVRIGNLIHVYDNRCLRVPMGEPAERWTLVTFPVKHHWREPADPTLIVDSAEQIVSMADKFGWTEVIMVRPGCGNGNLTWDIVKPLIADILDDRFLIVNK